MKHASQGPPAARVLLIDDDPEPSPALGTALARAGFETSSAQSSDDALRLVRSFDPHVIVLDLRAGGPPGGELALRLRATSPRNVQLIVLTARDAPLAQSLTRELGFIAQLIKPCAVVELVRLVRALRARAGERKLPD